jgi:hypothetical protein
MAWRSFIHLTGRGHPSFNPVGVKLSPPSDTTKSTQCQTYGDVGSPVTYFG